ncbi:hypothetical protein [Celeribacter neptunius]|uniref:Uncharacterized protein n=1 Tax=Celeribacter neptunius TaxID=588602 RepID=A0A1I3XWL5_9RHOB|nr:hypothetical protein [Celeribacter neptunius]SFK23461.1 hypothetical protein SAMN04487991_4169 [Celeribacter neptunius]
MKLRDYLSIPYIVQAQPFEVSEGVWVRRLSYPELGDFVAEGQDVEQVYLEIERLRYAEILKRLKAGDPPPVPREPLETADPGWWAEFLGISETVEGLLDKDAQELAAA